MKPFVLVMSLALIAFISVSAWAVPACFPHEESFGLQPTAVTFNGQPVSRSSTTGRYVTDAGLEFDHELAQATAFRDPAGTACPQQAQQVTVELIEPFSGQRMTLQLVSP